MSHLARFLAILGSGILVITGYALGIALAAEAYGDAGGVLVALSPIAILWAIFILALIWDATE